MWVLCGQEGIKIQRFSLALQYGDTVKKEVLVLHCIRNQKLIPNGINTSANPICNKD